MKLFENEPDEDVAGALNTIFQLIAQDSIAGCLSVVCTEV